MSKEHVYSYEAGYRDGSIHYELEHCPACKNVADLQEALAENASLKNEVELLKAIWTQVRLEGQSYKAENDRLLELVEDMLDCIQIRAAFSRPPTEEMYEMFYKRARELGVEE